MSTDFRALCADLLWALENAIRIIYREDGTKHISTADPIVARARAALAEPVGEGVTDEELLELAQHHSVSYTLSDGSVVYPLQEGCDMRDDVLSFARAVLARYGRHPAPPAAGEVVVADAIRAALARISDILVDSGRVLMADEREALELARQALEQRQAAPVPVAERLPGPEDCDGEGRCWWGERGIGDMYDPEWTYTTHKEAQEFCTFGPYSVWLPANALPLPQGEVEA